MAKPVKTTSIWGKLLGHDKAITRGYKRGYAAAESKARYGDFRSSRGSADTELRKGLAVVRAKSRWLARNSSSMKRFLTLLATNVVGKKGFVFESDVRRQDGSSDKTLNKRVETDYRAWAKRPTVCGKMSMVDLENQAIKSLARDGEFIWERVYNPIYRDGMAINPIEADLLDETLNTIHPETGNQIRMGVEIDRFNRHIAYHFLEQHPGDFTWYSYNTNRRHRRVLADNVIHVYLSDRASQTRGEPWASTVINSIKMLDGYREAETTGRRLRSAIMGFFTKMLPKSEGIEELADNEEDENRERLEMSIEPGKFQELPPGLEMKQFDPGGSQTDYEKFESQVKKDVAMGLGISVMSHGMETKGVSYSAGRTVRQEDLDFYEVIQEFIIDRALEPVFSWWLPRRLVQDDSNIPPTRIQAIIDKCKFRPRGWDWVDPAKDISSNTEALRTYQTSPQRVAAKQGTTFEEILDEHVEARRMVKERDLTLEYNTVTKSADESPEDDDNDNDDNDVEEDE
jgi:lambda family phage portal protein